jgi:ribosomal protein L10
MSKPVKEMMRRELIRRFEGVTSLAVVGFSGLDAVSTNRIRGRLRQRDIRMTVVKNSVARQAFEAVGLPSARGLLDGPCAVAYGADSVVSVVRELLDLRKEAPQLTVKAALLEGEVFGAQQIDELSRYPNRQEAIGRVVQCVLSPGGRLAGALRGPGGALAAALKTIADRQGQPEGGAGDQQEPAQEPAQEQART